jgi:broad specificity phosphatase PhoE
VSLRLLVYSDLHLEFARFEVPTGLDYDVAILAGDIAAPGGSAVRWAQRADTFGHRPVVLVPGNHEYYGSVRNAELQRMRSLARRSNVHLLDGDAAVIGGVRFLGTTLWTDFDLDAGHGLARRQAMHHARRGIPDFTGAILDGAARRPFSPGRARALHQRARRWLLAQLRRPFAGPTVVVSHHAPGRRSLDPHFAGSPLNPGFASELDAACFAGVNLWIHGHLHCNRHWRHPVHGTTVLCNPRGYVNARGQAENPSFDAHCLIDLATVDRDPARRPATRPRG